MSKEYLVGGDHEHGRVMGDTIRIFSDLISLKRFVIEETELRLLFFELIDGVVTKEFGEKEIYGMMGLESPSVILKRERETLRENLYFVERLIPPSNMIHDVIEHLLPDDHLISSKELEKIIEKYWKDHCRVTFAKTAPYIEVLDDIEWKWNFKEFYVTEEIWDKIRQILDKYRNEICSPTIMKNLSIEIRTLMEYAIHHQLVFVPIDKECFLKQSSPYNLIAPYLKMV